MDVQLTMTENGAELAYVNGQAVMSDGSDSAVVLSLFGGNEEDDGSDGATARQWWGNVLEEDDAYKLRSRTQAIMDGLPLTSANLRLCEEAMQEDLAWMLTDLATDVTATATVPRRNWVDIAGTVTVNPDTQFPFDFAQPWYQS